MKTNNIIDITLFLQECERIKNEGKGGITRVEYNPTSSFEEGERHDRLVKLAGSLSRQGLDLSTLTDTLLSLNDSLCTVPLPDKEVREIAKSIDKYKNYDRNPELREETNDTKQQVKNILYSSKRINANLKKQKISDLIIDDLVQNGKFIKTEGEECYYLSNETHETLHIDLENRNYQGLMSFYGINPQLPEYKFIFNAITIYCLHTGELSEVFKYSHYDIKNNVQYTKCSRNQFYKLTETGKPELCYNGTDGVLFSDIVEVQPFEYQNIEPDIDYIDERIISLCNFNENMVDAEIQAGLAKAFFISLFMPEFLPTKPILTVSGTKGSGKSTLERAMVKTLYGYKADVCAMPTKLEDLDVLVANAHFLPIDNLDTHKEGLNDKLAIYATGGKIRKRKLFTNSQIHEEKIDAFLGITTMGVTFKRDDILQRVLLLSVKPIPANSFIAETELFENIIKDRNKILSQLLNEVQKILQKIAQKKYLGYKTGFRMADFAKFYTLFLDEYKTAEQNLRKMTKCQQRTGLDNDIIVSYLAEFIHHSAEGVYYNANEIYSLLVNLIEKAEDKGHFIYNNEFIKSYKSVHAFAKRLNNIKSEIADFIKIETRQGRANQTEYQLLKGKKFDEISRVYKIASYDAVDKVL